MEFRTVVEGRRSIRKFEDKKIDRAVLEAITKEATFSPTWKNTQVVSFTIVDSADKKQEIADLCEKCYVYNGKTIARAAAVAVVTVKHGISGFEQDGSYSTPQKDHWESFDAGITTQTFCLAAYEQGVGSCVIGIFDEEGIKQVLGMGEDERIAALVALGYPEKESAMPPRKDVSEVLRFM